VDSGITTDTANATRQALAQTMATSVINSILAQNKISGAPPVLAAAPAFDFTRPATRKSPSPCKEPTCPLSLPASGEQNWSL